MKVKQVCTSLGLPAKFNFALLFWPYHMQAYTSMQNTLHSKYKLASRGPTFTICSLYNHGKTDMYKQDNLSFFCSFSNKWNSKVIMHSEMDRHYTRRCNDFTAYLMSMGLCLKSKFENYWIQNKIMMTPFQDTHIKEYIPMFFNKYILGRQYTKSKKANLDMIFFTKYDLY